MKTYERLCDCLGVAPKWHAASMCAALAGGFYLGYTHYGSRPVAGLEATVPLAGIMVLLPIFLVQYALFHASPRKPYGEALARIIVGACVAMPLVFVATALGNWLAPK